MDNSSILRFQHSRLSRQSQRTNSSAHLHEIPNVTLAIMATKHRLDANAWARAWSHLPYLHSYFHALHSSPPQFPSSPCWLGPSVAPTWIAARPRSSCHCCAVGAVRLPAWLGAARPEILPGPLPCTLPGPPTGWAGGGCGFRRAPGTQTGDCEEGVEPLVQVTGWSVRLF